MIRLAALVVPIVSAIREELRRQWRRLLAGAFVGWCVASVAGALLAAYLELERGYVLGPAQAAVFVWSGVLAGAFVGYSSRAERH